MLPWGQQRHTAHHPRAADLGTPSRVSAPHKARAPPCCQLSQPGLPNTPAEGPGGTSVQSVLLPPQESRGLL